LWAKQKTGEPNKEDLLSKINKFKIQFKRLIITLLLIITSFFYFHLGVHQPQMITTKIGIILTILAM
jgi:hypothetical protein